MIGSDRPLRILAVLQGNAEGGGGAHQSVNALITLARVAEGRFEVEVLDPGGSHREAIERAVRDGLMPRLREVASPAEPTGLRRRLKRSRALPARVARTLLQTGDRKDDLAAFIDSRPTDLVYFLHPSELAGRLRRRNVLTTVWDLCHRDFPEFPEVRAGGEFESREAILRSHVTRAVGVIVDAPQSADRMVGDYGVGRDRVLVMPFSPSEAVSSTDARSVHDVLARHAIEPGYLFYPAQFWPHKNHVRLIEALAIRKSAGEPERLVLAGGDKGNLKHVLATAERLGVEDDVFVLGYVDDVDLRGLYLGSKAVVVPTYFGPTNLPPLEAWAIGRPLIYPTHLAEQVGEAALLFDVDDAKELADRIRELRSSSVVDRLVENGHAALREWRSVQEQRTDELVQMLLAYRSRRATYA